MNQRINPLVSKFQPLCLKERIKSYNAKEGLVRSVMLKSLKFFLKLSAESALKEGGHRPSPITRSRNTSRMRVRDGWNRAERTFSGRTLHQIDSRFEFLITRDLSRAC